MITHEPGWNVTKEDVIYGDGYHDAERDTIKRVIRQLWELDKNLKLAFPELSEGIQTAIDHLEKANRYISL